MSAAVPLPSSALWRVPGHRSGSRPPSRANFAPLGDVSMPFPLPSDGHDYSSLERRMVSPATQVDESSHFESELRFDRLQLPELECNCRHKRVFGCFIAREALLDEEFWTAAWLRAESHWEDMSYVRHVESYKRKFADQEFASIKRRCSEQNAEKCTCVVVLRCSMYTYSLV